MQKRSEPQFFVFAHWADRRVVGAVKAGELCGTGYTVVVATRESMAREFCFQHLIAKDQGIHVSRACLELKDNDEVGFILEALGQAEPGESGVVAEFALTGEDWSAEPVLVYSRVPQTAHIIAN